MHGLEKYAKWDESRVLTAMESCNKGNSTLADIGQLMLLDIGQLMLFYFALTVSRHPRTFLPAAVFS